MDDDLDPAQISVWIQQLQGGQADGIEAAWTRYSEKLTQLVTGRTRKYRGTSIDPEEIVASVFESAWRASHEGRLKSIKKCDEIWWWLLKTTHFKTTDHIRRALKKSSGGGAYRKSLQDLVLELISREPDAAYLMALEEELEQALAILPDEKSRQIAVMKLEGFSNREIEEQMGIASATVQRKLKIIRSLWAKEMG